MNSCTSVGRGRHDAKPGWALGTVVLVCALLPGVLWMLHVKPEPVSDFARYYELARDLAHHRQFGYPEPTAYRLPFYPAFLSSFVVLGANATVLSAANVILCGIAATLLFLVVRALGMGLGCATAAGLLCALNPVFVFFSPVLASEHLFAVLLLLALLVAVRPARRPVRAALGTGILGGFAALTRGEGLFFLPVWLLALHLYQSRSKLQTAKLAVALLMAAAVVLFPWRLRNRLVIGPGVGLSTTAATNLYMAHNPGKYGYQPLDTTPLAGMDSSTRQKTAYRLVVGYLREDPRNLLADVVKGTKALFTRSGYAVRWSTKTVSAGKYTTRQVAGRSLFLLAERTAYPVLVLFSAVGWILGCWRLPRRAWFLLTACVAANWFCYAVVFWAKARYRYSTELVFCIFAGCIVWWLVERALLLKSSLQRSEERQTLAPSE